MNHSSTKLVEGVDYYLEVGRWVFTAADHLRRGHYCASGCRHGPYGKSPTDPVSTSDDQSPRVEECQ